MVHCCFKGWNNAVEPGCRHLLRGKCFETGPAPYPLMEHLGKITGTAVEPYVHKIVVVQRQCGPPPD